MWMRYCWAWPPRSLSERTMWWWKMCEVRLRLSLQAMQPWPLGRSSVGAPESGREACRLGGDEGWGTYTLSLLMELLTCRPQLPLCGYGWGPRAGENLGMRSRNSLRLFRISSPDFWPGPLKFSRTDHLASCLLRGRDLGLPSYTKARVTLGLPPVTRWQDINPALSRSDSTVRRGWAPGGRARGGGPGHTGLRHRRQTARHRHQRQAPGRGGRAHPGCFSQDHTPGWKLPDQQDQV